MMAANVVLVTIIFMRHVCVEVLGAMRINMIGGMREWLALFRMHIGCR